MLLAGSPHAAKPAAPLKYGDMVQVAPRTLMVVGRILRPAQHEGDVANAILYRKGETLYVVDTGATPSFRPFLRAAIDRLRPFRQIVVINTHGHPDHIGNNTLVAQVRPNALRHYMSRLDFTLADHYEAALNGAFERVSGYVPGVDNPAQQARALYQLFIPLEQSVSTRRAIESLPMQPVRIGKLAMQGWILGSNDVVLLQTAGHTHGQLIAYFPETHLLHMSDETVSYYPAFPEANAAKTRLAFTRGLDAASGGAVQLLTDGHTFAVYRGEGAVRSRLQAFLSGYDTYDRVVRGLLESAPSGLTVKQLVDAIGRSPELRHVPGGPNPGGEFFGALQVVTKLDQLHAVSSGGPRATRRFRLPAKSAAL
jgi:glyoxylase-like metal-dependent hydrolase (beta-lactamase superfamily II)